MPRNYYVLLTINSIKVNMGEILPVGMITSGQDEMRHKNCKITVFASLESWLNTKLWFVPGYQH